MSQAGTKTINVLLADDHDILRDGLSTVMNEFPDINVVGMAGSGWDAIDQCNALQPDVVLMDILMPDIDGLSATRIIREHHPNIRVVVLSSFEEEHLVQSAHEVGVSGYLLKNVSIDELANAIRDAYLGKPGTFPK
jgi:two-component system, NarL family, response regulator LiaR